MPDCFTPPADMPDPDALCQSLAALMRPHMQPHTLLVGIQTGGLWVAQRLHALLALPAPLGSMNVALHRDDFAQRGLATPGQRPSALPFAVHDAQVVLVDDVLYTGRTVRAALNELFDYGRPARVDLAVLVDRGQRELPIAPTWCALQLELPRALSLNLSRAADGALAFTQGAA